MALFVLIAVVFIAWLMWSSKAQKETFLGFAWVLMFVVGFLNFAWMLLAH